jgi:hypothetical protein
VCVLCQSSPGESVLIVLDDDSFYCSVCLPCMKTLEAADPPTKMIAITLFRLHRASASDQFSKLAEIHPKRY